MKKLPNFKSENFQISSLKAFRYQVKKFSVFKLKSFLVLTIITNSQFHPLHHSTPHSLIAWSLKKAFLSFSCCNLLFAQQIIENSKLMRLCVYVIISFLFSLKFSKKIAKNISQKGFFLLSFKIVLSFKCFKIFFLLQ